MIDVDSLFIIMTLSKTVYSDTQFQSFVRKFQSNFARVLPHKAIALKSMFSRLVDVTIQSYHV
jgi:hypothetical protein